ncbi:peroxiredoxin [Seminavis robusta]|uniref:Peroxiredoxin n=1 Tax=Seminavis robusta TaxID=568900 RepID=A0A9N8DEX9_9STRA|nr:peroxiredoxin [Seminavis robusta]|eukprot:Sro111_g055300.1 peroxiredoxin (177) ;mRNA; f:61184-61881
MKLVVQNLLAAALLLLATTCQAVKVGDSIPTDVELHFGFPPENINLSQRIASKKVILELGIDEVIVFCVNDGAVMNAWALDQNVPTDSIIKLMGDPYAVLTEKLDMELTHAGPKSVGLVNRCKRHALYIVNGSVKIVRVAEKDDDPAGDDFPDITLAGSMIEAIKELRSSSPKEEL